MKGKPKAVRRPVTAHDVARAAGVSQSAVSRAFTPGASIADPTRDAVLAAASRLGYRPNRIARSLITRRSYIVGVAMSYLENQFYPQALESLSQELQAHGYHILLFTADPGGHADTAVEEVLQYHVDALVLASTTLSSRLANDCRRAGVPVVLLNRTIEGSSVSSVTGDNVRGARDIAAFFAAGGHRRFAFMAGLENSSTSRERENGFRAWLQEHGYEAPAKAVGHYNFAVAMEAARSLLRLNPRPDALFCANDHMAIATLEVARSEFNLRVPEDLSIIGFDDVGAARWPSFALTSYAQPVATMVGEVTKLLLQLVKKPNMRQQRVIVPGRLIVRHTSRIPKNYMLAP